MLLNLRLDTLIESHDFDMALNLVKVCRQCLTNSDDRFLEYCLEEMKEQWLDVYLALTFRKQDNRNEFFQLIKQLADEAACQVVKRFTERRCESKGLWRKSLFRIPQLQLIGIQSRHHETQFNKRVINELVVYQFTICSLWRLE